MLNSRNNLSRIGLRKTVFVGLLWTMTLAPALPVHADRVYAHFKKAREIYALWQPAAPPAQLDAALNELSLALLIEPNNATLLHWTGFLKIKQRRYKEAIAPLKAAIHANPTQSNLHVNLGFVYYNLKDYDTAACELEQALTLLKFAPRTPSDKTDSGQRKHIYYNLGQVLMHANRLPEAIAAYRRASQQTFDISSTLAASGQTEPPNADAPPPPGDAAPLRDPQDPQTDSVDEADVQDALGVALATEAAALEQPSADKPGNKETNKEDSKEANKETNKEARLARDEAIAAFQRASRRCPTRVTFWLHLGQAYKAKADSASARSSEIPDAWDHAAQAFHQAVEHDSNNYAAREAWAEALVEQNKEEDALEQFDAAAQSRQAAGRSDLTPATTLFHWGLAAWRQRQTDAALQRFTRAANADPGSALAWQWMGYAQMERKQYDPAAVSLQKALALAPNAPDSAETHFNLGQTYMALSRFAEATEQFQRVLELRPDSAQAYCYLGQALWRQSRFAGAAEALRQAVRLDPDSRECKSGTTWHTLGCALQKIDQDTEALAAFEKAVQNAPDNAVFWIGLGMARMKHAVITRQKSDWEQARNALARGDADNSEDYPVCEAYAETLLQTDQAAAAITPLQRALPHDPQPFYALLRLGNAQEKARHAADAEQTYGRAATLKLPNPLDTLPAFQALGHLQAEQRRFAKAARTFQQALALAPGETQLYLDRYYCQTHLHGEAGDRQSADKSQTDDKAAGRAQTGNALAKERRETLEQALAHGSRGPQWMEARSLLAYEYSLTEDKADTNRAYDLYERALADTPDSFDILRGLGVTAYRLGRLAQAKSFLRRAIDLQPRDADTLNNLGIVYEDQDDLDKALEYFQKAVQANPAHSEARQNVASLQRLLRLLKSPNPPSVLTVAEQLPGRHRITWARLQDRRTRRVYPAGIDD